jgi:hypothetical protein
MKPSRRLWTYGVTSLGSLVLLIWLVWWVGGRLREEVRSLHCDSNLAQLALALDNYESAYGSLPPAAITDARGKPLLSWRVALLPFIEQESLYKKIKLDEAWDGPNNRRFNVERPSHFACPSHPDDAGLGFTSYVVVVGPRTLFPGGGKAKRRADIRDDPASTLMVVETTTLAINWMEPRDLEWDQMSFRLNDHSRPSISSDHHSGSYPGPHVIAAGVKAYPDNQVVAALVDSMNPATIRALLMIDDGEKVVLRRGPQ